MWTAKWHSVRKWKCQWCPLAVEAEVALGAEVEVTNVPNLACYRTLSCKILERVDVVALHGV